MEDAVSIPRRSGEKTVQTLSHLQPTRPAPLFLVPNAVGGVRPCGNTLPPKCWTSPTCWCPRWIRLAPCFCCGCCTSRGRRCSWSARRGRPRRRRRSCSSPSWTRSRPRSRGAPVAHSPLACRSRQLFNLARKQSWPFAGCRSQTRLRLGTDHT